MTMDRLCTGSLNVRGLGDITKRKSIFNFLKSKRFDIYLLQEVHCTADTTNLWKQQWGGKIYMSHGTTNSRGAMILINPKMDCEVELQFTDTEGRLLGISAVINGKTYLIINVYGPNEDKPTFFQDMIHMIGNCPDYDHLLIGGDFNFVLNPEMDRMDSMLNHTNCQELIAEYIKKENLCDIWRSRNPEIKQYTWCRQFIKGKLSASRIDFFLISEHLGSKVKTIDINVGFRTDHSLIELSIDLHENSRGPGVWKLNNLILNEDEYVELIKNCIGTINPYAADQILQHLR